MKPKSIIVFIAILALIVSVGCTKSDRSTGPAITVSEMPETAFNVTSNASMPTTAIESEGAVPQISRSRPPALAAIRGLYFKDKNGCVFLQQLKEKYIDLTFKVNTPVEVKNGVPVEVKGYWSAIPDGPCHNGPSFEVHSLSVLISGQTDIPPDQDQHY